MKKIVILNGSPRTNGNTKALIEHFMKDAKAPEMKSPALICRK